jgi:hypothetical protein
MNSLRRVQNRNGAAVRDFGRASCRGRHFAGPVAVRKHHPAWRKKLYAKGPGSLRMCSENTSADNFAPLSSVALAKEIRPRVGLDKRTAALLNYFNPH